MKDTNEFLGALLHHYLDVSIDGLNIERALGWVLELLEVFGHIVRN